MIEQDQREPVRELDGAWVDAGPMPLEDCVPSEAFSGE